MNPSNQFITAPKSIEHFDLPDADITLYNGFFDKNESDKYFDNLLTQIAWKQDQMKFFGKLFDLPRLTAWYGNIEKPYTYSGIPMIPLPWTDVLLRIKEEVEKVSGVNFTSVLLNQYRNGNDSVSWHSDNEKELGANPVIGSVSFGETRTFQLKHMHLPGKKANILLTHGSFLLMKGVTQHYWKHQIPKSKKALGPRINLTFRVIS